MAAKRRAGSKKKARTPSPRSKKAKIAALPKTQVWEITPEQQIVGAVFLGKVQGYYSNIRVMGLTLEAPLAVGETIRVKGHTTDLTQRVERIELERAAVASAAPGDAVGIEVADKVRPGDAVYKL